MPILGAEEVTTVRDESQSCCMKLWVYGEKRTLAKRGRQTIGQTSLDTVDRRLELAQVGPVILALDILQHTVNVALDVLDPSVQTFERLAWDALLGDRG
jgi:hypothetical protein